MIVFIIGGVGFILSLFVDRLFWEGDMKVVLIDNLLIGKRSNVFDYLDCIFIYGDVNNYEDLVFIFS